MSDIITRGLASGLTLVVEPGRSVASASLRWLIPAGSACDPPNQIGQATMLCEWIFRGAGDLTSRAHSDALDRLGVQRSAAVHPRHLVLGATLVGDRLHHALPLLTAMVRQPALPEDALESVRRGCIQAIEGLPDDPQHLVMLRLRERHFAPPLNRHPYGEPSVIERLEAAPLRQAWLERCVPGRSILAAAGAVDPDALAAQLDELLDGWTGQRPEPEETAPAARGRTHLDQDTSQVHLALAWDAPPERHDDAMLERLAVGVLSGGTSARLFTEVRQKRSLCYSVGASYHAGRDIGAVMLYAGTTPQRARETVDVCLAEVDRLRQGAEEDEFQRARTGLKSHLVMQGESTRARAAAVASDHFRLGRARSLEEIAAAVDAIGLDQLNDYLAGREIGPVTISTIGPVQPGVPAARAGVASAGGD